MILPNSINISAILFSNIILGTMITISSSSWLVAWLGLELNMLSFMPFMKSKNNPLSVEAAMKYFLIQAITSSIFIMMILQYSLDTFPFSSHYALTILIMVMLMKMALAPLHFWLPAMANSLSWNTLLMILTWQKIAPLSILMNLTYNFPFFMILNILMGAWLMINQTSIKKLLVYSSMTHLGWILTSTINSMASVVYFFAYTLTSITLINFLHKAKLYHTSQLPYMNYNNYLGFSFNMLSMVGFPPFLMFFPKLIIILKSFHISYLLTITMIFSSLFAMFAYLQIMWPLLLKPLNFSKINYPTSSLLQTSLMLTIPLITPLPLMYLMLM